MACANGNAIITTKQASGSARIDPLMDAFNAIALIYEPMVVATAHLFDIIKPSADYSFHGHHPSAI